MQLVLLAIGCGAILALVPFLDAGLPRIRFGVGVLGVLVAGVVIEGSAAFVLVLFTASCEDAGADCGNPRWHLLVPGIAVLALVLVPLAWVVRTQWRTTRRQIRRLNA